ncbi:MAG: MTH1187 family thiamine-binding protein [Fulvivirga sp.]
MDLPLVEMNNNHLINAAVQIVPLQGESHYNKYIDAAISVIQKSGLKYAVTPMETVIEGPKLKVLKLLDDVRETALDAGADELLVNIKLHLKKNKDVTFSEKLDKFKST